MLQHGILHESSCVYRPAQNGVAECKNRHMLEVARTLLFQMIVPKPFWADAVSTACFLINHMPSAVLSGNYPYSVLFTTKPLFPIDHKIFGNITFHEDLLYFRVTTYRHQEENDDLLVYVSPTPFETTKQSVELDSPSIKVYVRRPRITSDLVRKSSSQLKDAPIDAPNDAPIIAPNDAPNDAPNRYNLIPVVFSRRASIELYNIRRRKHPVGTHETWSYFGLTLEEASHAMGASERTLRRIIREDGYVAWPVDMVNVLVCAQFFIGGVYSRKRVFLVNRLLNWNQARHKRFNRNSLCSKQVQVLPKNSGVHCQRIIEREYDLTLKMELLQMVIKLY
ncbi:polyprotein [Tanacetum coccineum]|uniref:Polyprotein n=1 Tax=Tanacetum coccineum TaxID=301880 RepID=A0ABQ5AVF6_9ASTR